MSKEGNRSPRQRVSRVRGVGAETGEVAPPDQAARPGLGGDPLAADTGAQKNGRLG